MTDPADINHNPMRINMNTDITEDRLSQLRVERDSASEEDSDKGVEMGKAWAAHKASHRDLRRVAGLAGTIDGEIDPLYALICAYTNDTNPSRTECLGAIEELLGCSDGDDDEELKALAIGFVLGAAEAFEQVGGCAMDVSEALGAVRAIADNQKLATADHRRMTAALSLLRAVNRLEKTLQLAREEFDADPYAVLVGKVRPSSAEGTGDAPDLIHQAAVELVKDYLGSAINAEVSSAAGVSKQNSDLLAVADGEPEGSLERALNKLAAGRAEDATTELKLTIECGRQGDGWQQRQRLLLVVRMSLELLIAARSGG